MFGFSKHKNYNKIISKTLDKTVADFCERTPKISQHFFYGAVNLDPHHLVIWYLFETEAELAYAKESGFCDEIAEATKNNLISNGYPPEAFEATHRDIPTGMISFEGGTKEDHDALLKRLSVMQAKVCFTTEEDIQNKANGDYRTYFQ